jgi:hypothetical protein
MIMNHEYLMTTVSISFSLQGPVDIFGLSFDTGSGAAYTHSHTAYIVVVSEWRMGYDDELLIFLLCLSLLLSLKHVVPMLAAVFSPGLLRNLALIEARIISLMFVTAQKQILEDGVVQSV